MSGYNESPDTRFSRGTTRLMSCPDGERYSCHQQSLVVSLLLSLVSTHFFSLTGGVLPHQSSSTFTEVLPRHDSLYPLSPSLQRTQPFVKFLSLLDRQSRIFPAALADTRPRAPLISFRTVQLRTLCAAPSLAIFCLSTTPDSGPRELLGFCGWMVFHHAIIFRKESGNNNSKIEIADAFLVTKGLSKYVTKEVSNFRRS